MAKGFFEKYSAALVGISVLAGFGVFAYYLYNKQAGNISISLPCNTHIFEQPCIDAGCFWQFPTAPWCTTTNLVCQGYTQDECINYGCVYDQGVCSAPTITGETVCYTPEGTSGFFPEGTICGEGEAVAYPYSKQPVPSPEPSPY